MIRASRPILVLLLLFGLSHSGRAADEQRSEALQLYQEGLFQETGTGDLRMAEQVYRGIVVRFRQYRDITAAAVYRLGAVQEKQGKFKNAIAYFTMVVENFPDQENLFQQAKTKLYTLKRRPQPKEPAATPEPTPAPDAPVRDNLETAPPPSQPESSERSGLRVGAGINWMGAHLRLTDGKNLQLDLRLKAQDGENALGLRAAHCQALSSGKTPPCLVAGLEYAALFNPLSDSKYHVGGFAGLEIPLARHLSLGADWGYYYVNASHESGRLVSTVSRGDVSITVYFQ